jgi:hypothetical protein
VQHTLIAGRRVAHDFGLAGTTKRGVPARQSKMAVSSIMAHFKFLLDRGIQHLAHCFPAKRVITTGALGLAENAPDEEIVDAASQGEYLLIAANRRDFKAKVPAHIRKSTKKTMGCRRVCGLILLVPNEQHAQERVLKRLESRLFLEGEKVTYTDVHDRDLLVQVESEGAVRVSGLPRCPHCIYDDVPGQQRA